MKLTTAEEEIMQILWELGKATVREVLDKYESKKPAYNTVSTLIKILEKKKFINHETYGNTYVFYPIVPKEDYTKKYLSKFLKDYFNNSFPAMTSFFVKHENLSMDEIEEIMKTIKKER
jgi:predicted transcriptional regulator